ncbi:MAG: hypothetical protein ABID35_00300 [Candidatus Margulisiibacteriota bacterium]
MRAINTKLNNRGMFANASRIVDTMPNWPGLARFLITDAGSVVYRRRYGISNGLLKISVKYGQQVKTIAVLGLSGLDQIFVAIREERLRSGGGRKVLYGWEKEDDWGIMARARVRYVVAEKKSKTGLWELLTPPLVLKGLTEAQAAKRAGEATFEAVTKGLGRKKLTRWWRVNERERRPYVQYKCFAMQLRIYGFDGFERVYSVIAEEKGQIIGRFYADPASARSGEGMMKEVLLSEKDQAGHWSPLKPPKLIFAAASSTNQNHKIEVRRILDFLRADLPDGDVLDLKPRRVRSRGVRFHMGEDAEDRGAVSLNGYKDHQEVTGRLVVETGEKRAYFWPSPESRDQGDPPIIEQGHVMARRAAEKDAWELILRYAAKEVITRKAATRAYMRYLFATVGPKVYFDTWPIYSDIYRGRERRRITRKIRDVTMNVGVTKVSGLGEEAYSVTREVARMIKLVEFWPARQAFERGERALAARFITFNLNGLAGKEQNGRNWMPFWSKLDDVARFKKLIKDGFLTPAIFNEILGDEYLGDNYSSQVIGLVDNFKLFELTGVRS